MTKAELVEIPLIPKHFEGPFLSEPMIRDAEFEFVVTME